MEKGWGRGDVMYDMAVPATQEAAAGTTNGSLGGDAEHSTTNVQVAGVDEADVVKNDGEYIYTISGGDGYAPNGGEVVILKAYPPEEAGVVSRIGFDTDYNVNGLFLGEDRLAVIGSRRYYGGSEPGLGESDVMVPSSSITFVKVYDVADRSEPELVRTIEYEGAYNTARMIGGDIHVVLATYPYVIYDTGFDDLEPADVIPMVRDREGGEKTGGFAPACDWSAVEYTGDQDFSSFLSILSFPIEGNDPESLEKRVIAGGSDNVYASRDNLYVAETEYPYYYPMGLGESGSEEKTNIYKFSFDGPRTSFQGSAEVPGTILNQFSMDESDGYFRVATTRGHVSREGSETANNVYILGPDLEMTGALEGLAPGEKIYSARFMGDRAYLVTFKKVDPFFVLDLSDPSDPWVLGALKIPGYSDYLHPYDENHVIGVGKNAVGADPEEGDFAWYQGMKIALFDVTDVTDPREMYKVEIGDRGTDSYALDDHKAFLFDREKELLVLPVLLAELTPEQKASSDTRLYDYGDYTFQGAYVYDISLEGGIELRGRITHVDDPSELGESYYYYDSSEAVRRSLYIGDYLYTVSGAAVKVNRLADLGEVTGIRLDE